MGTVAGVGSATAISLAAAGVFATVGGPIGWVAAGGVIAAAAVTAAIVGIIRHCYSGFFATSGESVKDFFENRGPGSSGYID